MIVLNECRVSQDGNSLIVEATVENLNYYKNIYIDSVVIDTQKTFLESGPSDNPIYTEHFNLEYSDVGIMDGCSSLKSDEECKCGNIFVEGRIKHIRLSIPKEDLSKASLNDDIFFVYVIATGVPEACTPCGMDRRYVMGVAVNLRPIYNSAMAFIKELDQNCSIAKGFIDMILRIKAFEISLKTGNYISAMKQWHRLLRTRTPMSNYKPCGCNGAR